MLHHCCAVLPAGHTGELMKQAERYLSDGVHPRVIVEGFEVWMYYRR